jgi:hypothetical protein
MMPKKCEKRTIKSRACVPLREVGGGEILMKSKQKNCPKPPRKLLEANEHPANQDL